MSRTADGNVGGAPPAQGIPEGWTPHEKTDLRCGDWRFYYIEDEQIRSSVVEDNLVLKGTERMSGLDGLAAFLQEQRLSEQPDSIPPPTLAAQAAMFLIRGGSRQSCLFRVVSDPDKDAPGYPQRDKLHAPETRVESGRLIHRAWLKRGSNLQHMVITHDWAGRTEAEFPDLLPRA